MSHILLVIDQSHKQQHPHCLSHPENRKAGNTAILPRRLSELRLSVQLFVPQGPPEQGESMHEYHGLGSRHLGITGWIGRPT